MTRDREDALQLELHTIKNYCDAHSLSVTVAVSVSLAYFNGLHWFVNKVPPHLQCRLIACTAAGGSGPDVGMCLRVLRFSSPSRPTTALGAIGDIWITTQSGLEAVYTRLENVWVPWVRTNHVPHPFLTSWNLVYTAETVGWGYMIHSGPREASEDSNSIICGRCEGPASNPCGKCIPCVKPPVAEIVRELYHESGQPRQCGDSTVVHVFGTGAARINVPDVTDAPPTYESPANPQKTAAVLPECAGRAEPSPPAHSRHPTYWYAEGSIVVEVDKTYYRLFRTYLTRNSTFFADAVGSLAPHGTDHPSHTPSTTTVDGCPLVEVSGISNKDFEAWLSALENGTDYLQRTPSFSETASLVRASSTLGTTRVLEAATQILERLWTPHTGQASTAPSPPTEEEALEAIVLARAHDVPSILNSAYTFLLKVSDPVRLVLDVRSSGRPELALSDAEGALLAYVHRKAREDWLMSWIEASWLDVFRRCCWEDEETRFRAFVVENAKSFDPVSSYDRPAGADNANEFNCCPFCHEKLRDHWAAKKSELWGKMGGWLAEFEQA